MNLAETREAIADACTTALDGAKVLPYLPNTVKAGTGWVVRGLISTSEQVTFGELQCEFKVVVAVAQLNGYVETIADEYAVGLFNACLEVGGYGVTIDSESFTIGGADFHCLIATLITVLEAS